MRIDHHAYQRAARVAGFGFIVQAVIALVLLLFGLLTGDSAMTAAADYVFIGLLVWLSLIVIFYQHKLERLEALEEDELAATRGASESVFEAQNEQRVAARRLRLMHRWLMPIASLLVAAALALSATLMVRAPWAEGAERLVLQFTKHSGWGVAICLGLAAVAFILSRFVAGMAKLEAWHNLRGGAGYMVGNAIVLLALAIGQGVRIVSQGNTDIITAVVYALPFFMYGLAAEIVLNFVLNIYRPRIPGEVPRPAFDSRVLSLLSAPDSIVRSLNEAVNYQFGFDITSSWGYQLLLRSFVKLLVLGVVVLVGMSMMVVVEPHQQALRLRGGSVVGDRVYESGIMWKLPWPIETAEVYDVTRIRSLALTPELRDPTKSVYVWSDELKPRGEQVEPFIVSAHHKLAEADAQTTEVIDATKPAPDPEVADGVPGQFALVDAEFHLQYRIKSDAGALMDYLQFASDARIGRLGDAARDEAIKAVALREVTQQLSRVDMDEVIGRGRGDLSTKLRIDVQRALDGSGVTGGRSAGVDVVSINIPVMQPHSQTVVVGFEDLDMARQQRHKLVDEARSMVARNLSLFVGDPRRAEALTRAIEEWNRLREEDPQSEAALQKRAQIESLLENAGGQVALIFAQGTRDRLVPLLTARSRATRLRSQLAAYEAAPRLFRAREIMRAYTRAMQPLRKFVIGIDPERIESNVNMVEQDIIFTPDILERQSETQ